MVSREEILIVPLLRYTLGQPMNNLPELVAPVRWGSSWTAAPCKGPAVQLPGQLNTADTRNPKLRPGA